MKELKETNKEIKKTMPLLFYSLAGRIWKMSCQQVYKSGRTQIFRIYNSSSQKFWTYYLELEDLAS